MILWCRDELSSFAEATGSVAHWWAGARSAGGVGEGGNAEVDGLAAAGGDLVHLGELGLGAGEADLQAFGLAEPALGFGLGDAGDEVVADLDQAGSGGGVGAQQRAAQAAGLVDAGVWFGVRGAPAVGRSNSARAQVVPPG